MKHKINPLVDCVFKAILGKTQNKNLLIHFLNAVLEPEKGSLIQDVTITNPYNEREYIGDKMTVVDVKAVDESGKYYQVEVQLAMHPALTARILYTWSGIYHSQMQEGDLFKKLKPVISIWILNGILFDDVEEYHLPFAIYNLKHRLVLTDHLAIHLIQLPHWKFDGKIRNEKERWLYLFKNGQNIDTDDPPGILNTKEMRQVMQVIQGFSENQKNYLLYQSRLEANLLENTYIEGLKEALKEKEQALKDKRKAVKDKRKAVKEKEQALKEKEQMLKKVEALQLLLKKKGINLEEES